MSKMKATWIGMMPTNQYVEVRNAPAWTARRGVLEHPDAVEACLKDHVPGESAPRLIGSRSKKINSVYPILHPLGERVPLKLAE